MRRFLIVLATTVAVLMSGAVGAAADSWVFNNPYGDRAAKYRIINRVITAVQQSPRGSKIMVSTFLMDSRASADALLAAHRRKVQVQVVTDRQYANTYQMKRLIRAFNRDNNDLDPETGQPYVDPVTGEPLKWGRDNSFVVQCDNSCRGRSSNNHSKYYVFERTGSARHVTMVSSSNLNAGGAVKGFNDLYVARASLDLYRDYETTHAQMAEDTPSPYREFNSGKFTSRFYPKWGGGDPVLQDLSNVRCFGATNGAGRNGRTAINVSMFAWNNDRGMAIADRLVTLDRNGCDVSIIYGAPSKKVKERLMTSARAGGIKLWDSRYNRDYDPEFEVRTHHKYMLISGVYGANKSARRVHTGSQNWGQGTLAAGDENTLNIASAEAYRGYMNNWNTVRLYSRRIG